MWLPLSVPSATRRGGPGSCLARSTGRNATERPAWGSPGPAAQGWPGSRACGGEEGLAGPGLHGESLVRRSQATPDPVGCQGGRERSPGCLTALARGARRELRDGGLLGTSGPKIEHQPPEITGSRGVTEAGPGRAAPRLTAGGCWGGCFHKLWSWGGFVFVDWESVRAGKTALRCQTDRGRGHGLACLLAGQPAFPQPAATRGPQHTA